MRYCFWVKYVPGRQLVVADTLSRAPVDPAETVIVSLVHEHTTLFEQALQGSEKQIQRIRDETAQDPQLKGLLACLRSDWPRTQRELRHDVQQF